MTAPIWSKQPFKTLYLSYVLLKAPLFLTLLPLRYSLKWTRPTPKMTLRMCVVIALVREWFTYLTKTRSNGYAAVQSWHKKTIARFALATPPDARLFTGILASIKTKPTAVGGIWFPARPKPGTATLAHQRVILHIPGGAFVLAMGNAEVGRLVAKAAGKRLEAMTYLAQYRVAEDEGTRFPAAIQDCLTFYHYLLSFGFDPKNIILSGDSAGGNLVLALLRHLESTRQLPLPGGAMLWSPWVYVTAEAGNDYDQSSKKKTDFLVSSFLQWGVDAWLPKGKLSQDAVPYISPLHHPFKTTVPIFVHAGTGEVFHDPVRSFAQEMAEVNGESIRFHGTEQAPHCLIQCVEGIGMQQELDAALADACDLLGIVQ